MWNVKALLSLCLIATGTSFAGVAMYIQNEPTAFTSLRPSFEPRRGVTQVDRSLTPERTTAPTIVDIPAVEIRLDRHVPRQRVVEFAPEQPRAHCSDWRALSSGPQLRKVRSLCD